MLSVSCLCLLRCYVSVRAQRRLRDNVSQYILQVSTVVLFKFMFIFSNWICPFDNEANGISLEIAGVRILAENPNSHC